MFNKFIKKFDGKRYTTKGMQFGCPESEGEVVLNSEIKLEEVFFDPFDVFEKLGRESFLLIGRKGSGKSAYANFLTLKSSQDAELFCDFITRSDIELEKIVTKLESIDANINHEVLFKWIIYTKLISLIVQDESLNGTEEVQLLVKFFNKNRKMIEIDNTKLESIKSSEEIKIEPEYLRRYLGVGYKNSSEIFRKPAPFYELIEVLEDIIKQLFSKYNSTQNTYALFMDDLDIKFSINDENNMESLTNLIRVTRDINNRILGRIYPNIKVILLLRDDIAQFIKDRGGADTAKIISSYGIWLNWYEGGKGNPINLLKLVNERIKIAFKKRSLDLNELDPWSALIDEGSFDGNKVAFKYLLDHTFYRPRDLILILRALGRHDFEIPVKKYDVNRALSDFFEETISEVRNELACAYSNNEIDSIISVLDSVSQKGVSNIYGYELLDIIKDKLRERDPLNVAKELFNYSFIFNIGSDGKKYFKCRESDIEGKKYDFNLELQVGVHPAIALYFVRY
ncbi:hypothetical protein M899_0563 [Bacteriovorax sp. BSW11_IV]|uniref:P-loop ATPase, Sll1717 family n=1 Tax=Bacteriovorax sp. BSW11_IV TaxID=1353529 RepID=UPI000389EC5A|nr:hypothetical protein [Bacteriovorax sp. BSW11_IV]EQC45048.1 hypothetical protein M899_0563 [Bacteriovorax sp. BSW11_IV]